MNGAMRAGVCRSKDERILNLRRLKLPVNDFWGYFELGK